MIVNGAVGADVGAIEYAASPGCHTLGGYARATGTGLVEGAVDLDEALIYLLKLSR